MSDVVEMPRQWKAGDVVVIKTTGEAAIVLGPTMGGSGMLDVRFPNESGERGRFFEVIAVHPYEIATKLDNFKRELSFMKERALLTKAADREVNESELAATPVAKSEPSIN